MNLEVGAMCAILLQKPAANSRIAGGLYGQAPIISGYFKRQLGHLVYHQQSWTGHAIGR
jgi:hypothetical protein